MSYRNEVEALAARHAALSAEVANKTRELETASHILAEAREKAKLPVLPNIRVATPCSADWKAMTAVEGDRVRHCESCDKNVYNLSDMTRDEAEQLILAKEGRLCVRYFQRKDGTILLKDCEIGVSQKRKRRVIAAGAAALLAGGTGAAAVHHHKSVHHEEGHYIAGGIGSEPDTQVQATVLVKPLPQSHIDPNDVVEMKGGMRGGHDEDTPFAQAPKHKPVPQKHVHKKK